MHISPTMGFACPKHSSSRRIALVPNSKASTGIRSSLRMDEVHESQLPWQLHWEKPAGLNAEPREKAPVRHSRQQEWHRPRGGINVSEDPGKRVVQSQVRC
jgi:hypothetical protein